MDEEKDGAGRVDAVLEDVAAQTGAVPRREPSPGQEVRRRVLLDHTDDRGVQHEVAVLESDGTLRVSGRDQGCRLLVVV